MSYAIDRGRPLQSHLALVAVRMLIASYFLASAGLIRNADGATFLSSILPPAPAEMLATSIFYGTGFALMIGRFMREAALVLSIFIFWSSFGASLGQAPGNLQLTNLWRDMALVGAVLLIGLTQPGAAGRFRLPFLRARKPRRVSPETIIARRLGRPTGDVARPRLLPDAGDDEDEDDRNIFADLGHG